MQTTVSRVFSQVKGRIGTLFSTKYLLYTNTAISVCMSCTGDGMQQKYQILNNKMPGWDKKRSRDVGITGFLIGPFCHFWYIYLDRWFPGRGAAVVTKKLLVDQLVCSPIAITSFLIVTSFLEGKRGRAMIEELKQKGKTLYIAEWLIWPPAQIINFSLLPTRYRVLFDNTVSLGFDWYFSYVKYPIASEMHEGLGMKDVEVSPWSLSDHNASHMPFLHMQAADIVQLKQENFHIMSDKWHERHQRHCSTSRGIDSSFIEFLNVMYELEDFAQEPSDNNSQNAGAGPDK